MMMMMSSVHVIVILSNRMKKTHLLIVVERAIQQQSLSGRLPFFFYAGRKISANQLFSWLHKERDGLIGRTLDWICSRMII